MPWSHVQLADLPIQGGFRLRGLEITRLETFTDAAFAFATTMLVISLSGIPETYEALIEAFKGTPAFAASFATIASFWYNHRQWSRRYGLEDRVSILISLMLIFIMLVYVYPLKMVFSAMFYWISGGWLPTIFTLSESWQMPRLFVFYGVGFFALGGVLCLLYARALSLADALRLNTRERLITRQEITTFGVMSATGVASALMALFSPPQIGMWSGFVYTTLVISMPIVATVFARRIKALDGED